MESFGRYIARIKTQGTETVVSDFRGPGMWVKRKYVATELNYEVKKAESGAVTARATWQPMTYIVGPFATRSDAEKAVLPSKPRGPSSAKYWAEFVLENGNWLDLRYSTTDDNKDPIHDWWRALGGKPNK